MTTLFLFLLLATADPGDQIDRTRLLEVESIYELTGSHAGCEITSVTITWVPGDSSKDPMEVINRGTQISDATLDLLRRSSTNDTFHFREIQSVGDCMRHQKRGTGFALRVQ